MGVEEVVGAVPPLPVSPPPTEAPPPTPVAPAPPAQESAPAPVAVAEPAQTEHEEVNGGGGEGMAEVLPEENGLVYEDEDDGQPKVNGHQSPVKQVRPQIFSR